MEGLGMIGLIIILAVAAMLSYILKKDPETVLPSFMMTLLLGIYALGILKKSHHAYSLSLCAFLVIAVVFVVFLFKRRPRLSLTGLLAWVREHVGFITFLCVCVLMIWCYHTHFVMVWDDFHYNATFPKDCYFYGTMPVGNHSATFYKSYLPLMQLFFYWGFQAAGFSEAIMFQYKMVLIYVLILPVFARMNGVGVLRKIATGVFAGILPFLFLNEVQESLSMDCVVGLLFAYAMVRILGSRVHDWFEYYDIAVALMCLTLMKTISVIFTAIALGTWFVYVMFGDRKDLRKEIAGIFGTGVLCVVAYFSWKVFCNLNGNSNYLSDRLGVNITNGTGIPDYAANTVREMVKSLWTMHLHLGPWGLSMAGILIFALVLGIIMKYCGDLTRQDVIAAVMILLGFIGYFAVLCYTYVFVFDKWEADSLSSFDRYIGTYALTVCYVAMYRFSFVSDKSVESKSGYFFPIATAVLFVTLPFTTMSDVLNPGGYVNNHINTYNGLVEVKDELAAMDIREMGSGYIVIVQCEENSVYSRGMDYEVIPLVSRPYNVTAFDEADRDAELTDRLNTYEPDYIYFSAHEREYEDISLYTIPDNYAKVDGVEGLFRKQGI